MSPKTEIEAFLVATQFLTRLPVPTPDWHADSLRRATRWFPLVGAGIGAFGGGLYVVAATLVPQHLAAGVALGGMIWATGALHEDGLADTADGLGGNWDWERALQIMRDSSIGTYGTVALVLSLGLRWGAIAVLPLGGGAVLALALAAATARGMIVLASAWLPPARPEGLGAMLADGPGARNAVLALVVPFLLAGALGVAGAAVLLAAALAGAMLALLLRRRLGGHTGDGLGAVSAVAETAALVALAGAYA